MVIICNLVCDLPMMLMQTQYVHWSLKSDSDWWQNCLTYLHDEDPSETGQFWHCWARQNRPDVISQKTSTVLSSMGSCFVKLPSWQTLVSAFAILIPFCLNISKETSREMQRMAMHHDRWRLLKVLLIGKMQIENYSREISALKAGKPFYQMALLYFICRHASTV